MRLIKLVASALATLVPAACSFIGGGCNSTCTMKCVANVDPSRPTARPDDVTESRYLPYYLCVPDPCTVSLPSSSYREVEARYCEGSND